MRNEKISFAINCFADGNSFEPGSLDERVLIDLGIIKDAKDLIESRPGSIATYFRLRKKETIKVTKKELSISTISYDSSIKLFNSLTVFFKNSPLNKVEFKIDEHFIDEDYPEKVFGKFPNFDDLDLDVFRYKKDNYSFTVYNCQPNQMHLKIDFLEDFGQKIKIEKIDFEELFDLESLWKLRDIFINNLFNN